MTKFKSRIFLKFLDIMVSFILRINFFFNEIFKKYYLPSNWVKFPPLHVSDSPTLQQWDDLLWKMIKGHWHGNHPLADRPYNSYVCFAIRGWQDALCSYNPCRMIAVDLRDVTNKGWKGSATVLFFHPIGLNHVSIHPSHPLPLHRNQISTNPIKRALSRCRVTVCEVTRDGSICPGDKGSHAPLQTSLHCWPRPFAQNCHPGVNPTCWLNKPKSNLLPLITTLSTYVTTFF